MACGLSGCPRLGWRRRRFVVALALFALCPAAWAEADAETRDFTVYIDAKKAGDVHMTINSKGDGDGTTSVACDTDVRVGALIPLYTYSYRGKEVWKDGRLQQFESKCDDNGKKYEVFATAADDGLHVLVNNAGHTAPADVLLTTYWSEPDAKQNNQTVAILDADCGRDLSAKVELVGAEKFRPDGQEQTVQHFRLTGKGVGIDLWYDDAKRLVREEWIEDGHRTIVNLKDVRR